jgi:hypothetical protein
MPITGTLMFGYIVRRLGATADPRQRRASGN